MPRDVSTRWNSTYDMIAFAVEYQDVIDQILSDKARGLRAYELSEREWLVAKQLGEVLKVRRLSDHLPHCQIRTITNLLTTLFAPRYLGARWDTFGTRM
jgi:hypothetical protein